MDVRLTVDDARVLRALEKLNLYSSGHARPAMSEVGRYIKTTVQLRFDRQQGPDGVRWKPSIRAKKTGGQTLRKTSRLRNSFTVVATDRDVAVGTNVVYAAAHQFGVHKIESVGAHRRISTRKASRKNGGRVSALNYSVRAHTRMANTPIRAFLGFNRDDVTEILAIFQDHIRRLGA